MKKRILMGVLAFSLIGSTGLAAAAKGGEHGQGSSGKQVEKKADQAKPDNQPSQGKNQVKLEASSKDKFESKAPMKDQSKPEVKDQVTQETKDQIKARVKESLKTKKAEEIKAELKEKVQKLSKEFQFGQSEKYTELGQYYQAMGDTSLKTFVNGETPEMDVPPFIQGGRAMVPVRAIVAALKAEVNWDAATQTVTVTRGDTEIVLQIGSQDYTVNGEPGTFEVAATLKHGRTFLPFRAISELLGAKVDYVDEGSIIVVEDPSTEDPEQEPGTEIPAMEGPEGTDATDTQVINETPDPTTEEGVNQEEQTPAPTDDSAPADESDASTDSSITTEPTTAG